MGCRKQQSLSFEVLIGAFLIGIATGPATAFAASTITSIDFTGTQDPHNLTIQADGPITVTQQNSEADRQIILEVSNAILPRRLARRIDTSSFDGNITLISPYQVDGRSDTVRIVLQLREPGTATLTETATSATLLIPRQAGANAQASTEPKAPLDEAPVPRSNGAATLDQAAKPNVLKGTEQQLDEFIQSRNTQRFTGRPITLQVREVDAADVFRLIAEASGFNIILGEGVKGEVTLSLVDVPWDQALDVLLKTLHLGAERNNNVLRVVTLENLRAEKIAELAAREASEASAPRITRIFPISYANLKELAEIVARFASSPADSTPEPPPSAPAAGAPTGAPAVAAGPPSAGGGTESNRSIVEIDNRTNSIIVRDLPENLERMQKLIALLDTQTPQVMIEAKVVEATESFSKSMSGTLGLTGQHGLAGYGTNEVVAAFAGGNPIDPLIGSIFGSSPTPTSIAPVTQNAGLIGFSPNLQFVSGFRLNAVLNMGESESQVKVISSPKTVVLNKESAKIVQGTPVLVPGTSIVEGSIVATNTVTSANLSLDVKPTVTNEGSVLMNLAISRDVPIPLLGGEDGQVAVGTRNMNTIVLVESGSTLVIGGIYTASSNESSAGFPFLRKIPILGTFFGSEIGSSNRSELFIFITPRILNPKEAGLSG